MVAGDKPQEILLTGEFPGIEYLPLPGYGVKYGSTGRKTVLQLLLQAPGILKSVKKETEWLSSAIKQYSINAVISDNRFGLYNHRVPSVFITHQLSIVSPFGKFSEPWLQQKNYSFINKFTECWVPDVQNENNLAGRLSHPKKLPVTPVKYIGPLSRFSFEDMPEENRLLVILSGPEPQRTVFENIILKELENFNGTATMVRGLPESSSLIPSTSRLTFHNHLRAKELELEIKKSHLIISRCGYSTVMDMAAMKKKCVLVPTPGQTEQRYLSKHLSKRGLAIYMDQKEFSLKTALQKANNFDTQFSAYGTSELLENAIDDFLNRL